MKFGNEISAQDIDFANSKMTVRLAVQTFSSSVANAIEMHEKFAIQNFKVQLLKLDLSG